MNANNIYEQAAKMLATLPVDALETNVKEGEHGITIEAVIRDSSQVRVRLSRFVPYSETAMSNLDTHQNGIILNAVTVACGLIGNVKDDPEASVITCHSGAEPESTPETAEPESTPETAEPESTPETAEPARCTRKRRAPAKGEVTPAAEPESVSVEAVGEVALESEQPEETTCSGTDEELAPATSASAAEQPEVPAADEEPAAADEPLDAAARLEAARNVIFTMNERGTAAAASSRTGRVLEFVGRPLGELMDNRPGFFNLLYKGLIKKTPFVEGEVAEAVLVLHESIYPSETEKK